MRTLIIALLIAAPSLAQLSLSTPTTIPAATEPGDAVVADLDLDGTLDIAVTLATTDRVDVIQGPGYGTVASTLLAGSSRPFAMKAGDLDGDGDADLIVSLRDLNGIQPLLNNAGLFLLPGVSVACGSEPENMILEDLDGDGDLDVVTSNRASNDISVLLNSGVGSFSLTATIPVAGEPLDIVAADLDGDSDLDLAIAIGANRTIEVLTNNGSAGFTAGAILSLGPQLEPEGIAAVDLDGNGFVDIVSTGMGGGVDQVLVFFGTGAMSFLPPLGTALAGTSPSALEAADLDGDGDQDVVVALRDNNTITVLENNSGLLSAVATLPVGMTPTRILLADVDGGLPEILVSNEMSNTLSLFSNLTPHYPTNYPGTGEDLTTTYATNSGPFITAGGGADVVSVAPGDVLTIVHDSPGGTFDGLGQALVFGSALPSGSTFSTVLPGIHAHLATSFLAITTNLLGYPLAVPTSYTFAYPGGAAGTSVLLQCAVSTSTAANSIYASTDGLELLFL